MRFNFVNLSNLTLLVALSLSTVAAYYSIIGLTAIFAGAVIPIIVMGGILEVGKITATVWLRKYWHRCGLVLKLYLVPAVVMLAFLTSMGIFGFLSRAHSDQGLVSGDVQAKIAVYDEKIKIAKENIDANRKALKQLDEAVDQVMGRSTTETGADKAVAIRKGQAKERARLLQEITAEQKNIAKLSEERAPIAAEIRKVEAEVGPIKYIAAFIYGDNPDANLLERAVRWVIILLVAVFDPLAIALVLAANASREWDKEKPKEDEPKVDDPVEEPVVEIVEEKKIEEPEPTPAPIAVDTETVVVVPEEKPKKKRIVAKKAVLKDPEPVIKKVTARKTVAKKSPTKKAAPKKKVVEESEPAKVEILAAGVVDRPGDYLTDADMHMMQVKQDLPYQELPGGYAAYQGKHMSKDALFTMHPEFLKLTADLSKPVNSGFGIRFPNEASKGDVFTRVDVLPNKVFKFDGTTWIEMNKKTSNTYLYNTQYLDYLIEMIDKGQYDIEMLNDNERGHLEDYLKLQKLKANKAS